MTQLCWTFMTTLWINKISRKTTSLLSCIPHAVGKVLTLLYFSNQAVCFIILYGVKTGRQYYTVVGHWRDVVYISQTAGEGRGRSTGDIVPSILVRLLGRNCSLASVFLGVAYFLMNANICLKRKRLRRCLLVSLKAFSSLKCNKNIVRGWAPPGLAQGAYVQQLDFVVGTGKGRGRDA